MVLPLQDRARVYRTWSVCRAEGNRQSADSGKEVPNTAETSFQMHGCRNWRMSSIKRGLWTTLTALFCFLHKECMYFTILCLLPENRKVWGLHQHIHQGVNHLCVENNGVHHFAQFLVVSQTKTGFWNTCVRLQKREGTQKRKERSVPKIPKFLIPKIRNHVGGIRQTHLSITLLRYVQSEAFTGVR